MKGKTAFVVIIIAVAASVIAVPKIYGRIMRIMYPVRYEDIIEKYAKENELDPYLVLGLIKAESNFVSDACSHRGAHGLMQITESTAAWCATKMKLENFSGGESLVEPETNIKIGCWYLKYLLDEYDGSAELALCAYNAGIGNVGKWLDDKNYSPDGVTLEKIPFPETEKYVVNTQSYMKRYSELYPKLFGNG